MSVINMSMSLCRFAARTVRPRVGFPGIQLVAPASLATAARTPFCTAVARLSKSRSISRPFGTEVWCRGSSLWLWICALARGGQKGRRPSGRVLLCGAVAFLWDRERIGNEDVISCLKEYDDRVKSQLHATLEPQPLPTPLPAPSAPDQEVTSVQDPMFDFKQELHTLLQQSSKEHMSRLPLVGLRKMGPLSRISVKALSALRIVSHKAADRLGEAKAHVYASLKTSSSGKAEESDNNVEVETFFTKQTNETTVEMSPIQVDDQVGQESCDTEGDDGGALKEAMLAYHSEHSRRHTAQLPLVGLRPPGPAYTLSVKIADSCWRLFGGETHLQSQASFMAHLALALCDAPSIPTFPVTIAGLQASSAAVVSEEFTASSVKEAVDGAIRQARAMLKQTVSDPRSMIAVFDSVSGCKGDPDSTGGQQQERDQPSHEKTQSSVVDAQHNIGSVDENVHLFVGNTSSIDTDSYLAQSGWDRFAEAKNCTVYRRLHQTSGLYMYKVIGGYKDISIRDFLYVQVDLTCRKSWDTYVQRLETVDVDPETGSEVIHWIMAFPFPMSSREYVYVRRMWVSKNAAVLISRSVDHPAVPECRKYVRVQNCDSRMVLQPHTTTDQDGFEFELTYFDNPQTNLPASCVNWVATAAMPDYLAKVYAAVLQRRATSTASNNQGILM